MKYYPHTSGEIREMLDSIGVSSVDELFSDIPREKIIKGLNLPAPMGESDVIKVFTRMSDSNRAYYDKPSFLGAGSYRHFTPSVVDAVISRSEFYTAYTPYQAEASQGILQTIFEYQTLISMLTGMEASNASLYDGATACAEAVNMAVGHTRKREVLYSAGLHPEYIDTMKTYFRHNDNVTLREVPMNSGITCVESLRGMLGKDTAGVIIQSPNCLGFIEPAEKISTLIHEVNSKALSIVAVTEAHSLGLLKSPGECGADIAIGEGVGLGISPSFGGPYLGFIGVKSKLLRQIPGRLVGQTVDTDGDRAYCLTLQAREQHIRREKAASNICSNEALCALAATVYMSYVGKHGFANIAKLNMEKAHYMKERLVGIAGFEMAASQPFFNEFTLKCPGDPVRIDRYLKKRGIVGGFVTGKWRPEWKNYMTFCATEMNSRHEIDDLAGYLESYCREEVASECMIG